LTDSSPIHVAVGVLLNAAGQVLISRRHPDSHQGGLWEFPGGKVEAGEDVQSALKREFKEELGVIPLACSPFQKITHHYADKSVLLDVWSISSSEGEPAGLEGQAVEWRSVSALQARDFPAANARIIKCLSLPREIAITPDVKTSEVLQSLLEQLIAKGLKVIQIRQTHLTGEQYLDWFQRASSSCHGKGVALLLNQDLALFGGSGAAGFHANARRLLQLQQRPVAEELLFSASCHSLDELRKAEALGADFVSLSPVGSTAKYAAGDQLGWDKFQRLASSVNLPVYALGGMGSTDRDQVLRHNGFGIAGIRTFL
jgi:8-oxo-dGTP diphosphatase